ncbi:MULTISPECIES: ABC transporter ATP-binding protein [Aerococcus]|uniref:ABC transporter ATP-binding protein n=1 Tax=Aerococcus viridans TaxID=1377 RepID=A0A2N6UDA6_9LACT|nr:MULTISPECIES: ABC transporter ATP-binding protein [Aerococcus]OFU49344.1 multidrug ABC transporter ATP-binding protein [Aerococcus sp. HMSC10H05]PMC79524.1 ABC transporter ATP-binding protein [Aerococcus viridans]
MWRLIKRIPPWAMFGAVVFALTQAIGELLLPTQTARIIDDGVAAGDMQAIYRIGGQMILITMLVIISAGISVYISARTSQDLGRKLRNEIYAKVLHFSKENMGDYGEASLITRSSNDIQQVEVTVMMIMRMVLLSPAMLLAAVVMAVLASPELSLVYAVSGPVLAFLIFIILRIVSPYFKSMQRKVDNLNLIFREGLTGVRVVRAFNKSDFEVNRFAKANKDYADTAIKAMFRMSFLMPIMTTILSLTNITLSWRGAQLVAAQKLSVGVILSFVNYSFIIMFSFMMLGMIFVILPRAQVSAQRINEILDTEITIHSPKNPITIDRQTPGEVAFEDVAFRFGNAEHNVVEDINFQIKPGETLAIIGGTGSGKTTIANLLLRFSDVSKGAVKINHHDVRDLSLSNLRDLVGYVPQKANLFSGTIRENLKYGNREATDEELWHALRIAQSESFVRELPEGLDAHVAQGGNNFSGGQKQRLCIARAIVKQANIYLFDDSFSALDYTTDRNLRGALKEVTENAATIIIAQRVSTIRDADTIVVLDKGEISGIGTHDELMSNDIYREIVESQIKGAD